MQRFYYNKELTDKLVITDKDIIHQIIKVLRAQTGDSFVFFDENIDVIYELKSISKKELIFNKLEIINKTSSENKDISLYQSIPNKIEKIELILQKCTEIGVKNFYFFKAERTQKMHISDKKLERFRKIVIEAIEQSHQNIIPEIKFIDSIDFESIKQDTNIYFHTKDDQSIGLGEIKISNDINIFIGPEGGFTDKEIDKFDNEDFKKVYLGKNILRTETCAIGVSFYLSQIL